VKGLFLCGLSLLSASPLSAQLELIWYVHSTLYTAGAPGTWDVTIGIRADSGPDVGYLGNFDLEGDMNLTTFYDFGEGPLGPFLLSDLLSNDYDLTVDNPVGDQEWNLEGLYVDTSSDQVTQAGILVATIRFYIKNWGATGFTLGVSAHQETYRDNLEVVNVTYDNSGGQSLPVQMSSLTAAADEESGVTISWQTQSETGCAGFHVWKSLNETDGYECITTAMIPGQGNTSTAHDYSYTDPYVEDGVLYWYKVEEISMTGESTFYGPISVMGIDPVPDDFALSQNYPNPFNSETWFQYQLTEDCEVRISVFDLLGKRIRTILHEKQSHGYYSDHWDGKTEAGEPVPSGIYLLYLKTEPFTQIRRMTVLR
jgi:hypothetical protein